MSDSNKPDFNDPDFRDGYWNAIWTAAALFLVGGAVGGFIMAKTVAILCGTHFQHSIRGWRAA